MRFDIAETSMKGLMVLYRKPIGDDRGFLERMYCAAELQSFTARQIVQINRTLTVAQGTVRGMHFQRPPHAEAKFVSCLRGEVFDVAVDVRERSPTFLQWHAEVLGEADHKTFFIPEGFAHGFQTLTANCEMLYFHTAAYRADAEDGLNARDERLSIEWPLPIAEQSLRDLSHPAIGVGFSGVLP